ncbi:MAG: hypothetical protein LUE17_10125 [Planctomycetaceae bacterium]|nr:hypothetical protein [Planctomycetaceae bacterium]
MNPKTSEFLRRFGSLIGLILLCIIIALMSDKFLSMKNLINVARQSSITALLALGVLLPILPAAPTCRSAPSRALPCVSWPTWWSR